MLRWTIEGTGETEKLIAGAEERLNVRFPESYRTMLKEHSGGDSEELETMLMTDEIQPMTELGDYDCMAGWVPEYLARVFPIFSSGDGNYYALDYSEGDVPAVLDIDKHRDEEEGPSRYENFDVFIATIVKNAETVREQERQSRPAFGR